MASILNHQIIGSINNLNQKMSSHARLILGISLELDKLRSENEELKKILKGHKIAIKQIRQELPDNQTEIRMEPNSDLKKQFQEYETNNQVDININSNIESKVLPELNSDINKNETINLMA